VIKDQAIPQNIFKRCCLQSSIGYYGSALLLGAFLVVGKLDFVDDRDEFQLLGCQATGAVEEIGSTADEILAIGSYGSNSQFLAMDNHRGRVGLNFLEGSSGFDQFGLKEVDGGL
jgi:hypothetical protein